MNREATRKLYHFERRYIEVVLAGVDEPMEDLQALAWAVWHDHTDHRRTLPDVVAGRGIPATGRFVSFQMGQRIELARHQRNRIVLLHEMAHWLTPLSKLDHGPAFCRTYFMLLGFYMNAEVEAMTAVAKAYGLPV